MHMYRVSSDQGRIYGLGALSEDRRGGGRESVRGHSREARTREGGGRRAGRGREKQNRVTHRRQGREQRRAEQRVEKREAEKSGRA